MTTTAPRIVLVGKTGPAFGAQVTFEHQGSKIVTGAAEALIAKVGRSRTVELITALIITDTEGAVL